MISPFFFRSIRQFTKPVRSVLRIVRSMTFDHVAHIEAAEKAGCPVAEDMPVSMLRHPDWLYFLHRRGKCILSRDPHKPHRWIVDLRLLWTLWNDYLRPEMKFKDLCTLFHDTKGKHIKARYIEKHTYKTNYPTFDKETMAGLKRIFHNLPEDEKPYLLIRKPD